MSIVELSETDYYAHLERPYNPADAATTEAAFDEEYYALFRRVAAVLCEHGTNDPYNQGDYSLEPHIAKSRGLGVSITNAAMVTPNLLRILRDVVSQHAPTWEITWIVPIQFWHLHRSRSDSASPQHSSASAAVG